MIELLAVIAIIVLLLSILMPALQRVRKQAKGVTCRDNLKQAGLAFNMYTEGKFPRNGGIWIVKFLPYIGGQGDQDEDFREMGVYNCSSYPNKEQTLDYVINSWKDGETELIGYSPARDEDISGRQRGWAISAGHHKGRRIGRQRQFRRLASTAPAHGRRRTAAGGQGPPPRRRQCGIHGWRLRLDPRREDAPRNMGSQVIGL